MLLTNVSVKRKYEDRCSQLLTFFSLSLFFLQFRNPESQRSTEKKLTKLSVSVLKRVGQIRLKIEKLNRRQVSLRSHGFYQCPCIVSLMIYQLRLVHVLSSF